jgi:hypothetical protein
VEVGVGVGLVDTEGDLVAHSKERCLNTYLKQRKSNTSYLLVG